MDISESEGEEVNAEIKGKIDKFVESYRPHNFDGHTKALQELLLAVRIEERRKCVRLLDRHGFLNASKLIDPTPRKRKPKR